MEINEYMLVLFGAVVIASFSQVLLKKGASHIYRTKIREYLNVYVICGYGMMVVTTILNVLAYRGIEYKNGPVVESLGYVLIMVLSRLYFHEKITKNKLIGNVLILIGVFIFYIK